MWPTGAVADKQTASDDLCDTTKMFVTTSSYSCERVRIFIQRHSLEEINVFHNDNNNNDNDNVELYDNAAAVKPA